ncbi:hypothetical protein Tco_0908545 [Tanacetum coccineum]|uniref:Uncharacterized protein n=1 Tax=Tanacetum coccineum TaxID=301880 RepID=A0ABQ5CNK6_9ASTR
MDIEVENKWVGLVLCHLLLRLGLCIVMVWVRLVRALPWGLARKYVAHSLIHRVIQHKNLAIYEAIITENDVRKICSSEIMIAGYPPLQHADGFAKMSVPVIHRHEKNIDTAADFDVIHAETKQLQKMSLSDPQEQNKKNDLVGSGSNQLRTPSPGAYSCVDNDFERLFSTEAMKRQREWHALHSCTKCGVCKHRCRCNVRAPRWSHWDGPSEFLKIPAKKVSFVVIRNELNMLFVVVSQKKIYDDDARPPSRAKRNQKVLDEMKDFKFRLVVVCPEK